MRTSTGFLQRAWTVMTRPGMSCSAALADALPPRHRTATILIHWGTAAAIVIGVVAVWLRDATEDDAARVWLLEIHRQTGMLVLLGAGVRIAIRQWLGLTNYAPDMPAPLHLAAISTHLALYALLIALPLLGWAASSAHHVTLSLFGLFPCRRWWGPIPTLPIPCPTIIPGPHGPCSASLACTRPPRCGIISSFATGCCAPCCPAGASAVQRRSLPPGSNEKALTWPAR